MTSHKIWTQDLYALRRRTILSKIIRVLPDLLETRTHRTEQATTPASIMPLGRLTDRTISKAAVVKRFWLFRLMMSICQIVQQINSNPDLLLRSSSVYCKLRAYHSRILARRNRLLLMVFP